MADNKDSVNYVAFCPSYLHIEKAKALLGPSLPRGELSELFSLALRNLVEGLEKKKYAKTSRSDLLSSSAELLTRPVRLSRPTDRGTSRITSSDEEGKRSDRARDGAQCTFADENGNRCQERWGLEFHHDEVPFARGGSSTVQNTTLHCRAHNQLMAERDFGADFIAAKKAAAKAKKFSAVMSQ